MLQGTVRWFDVAKGFGFIAPDDEGPDLFVHVKELVDDSPSRVLREGQVVEFDVVEGDRGPQARNVRVTGEVATAALGVLGTIAWYEPGKGYGFASPDGGGPEVFVHSSSIVTGGVVHEGQRVAFLVTEGERGPQAEHVVPLAVTPGAPGASAPSDDADGTVAWYDEGKGFGFITPDGGGPDVFVHARDLTEGLNWLAEGDRVAYAPAHGERGPQAREVVLVREAPVSASKGGGKQGGSGGPGTGTVARYDEERGFGFITPDVGGDDLFVHFSVVQGREVLHRGDRVRFTTRQSDRGPQADRVERL